MTRNFKRALYRITNKEITSDQAKQYYLTCKKVFNKVQQDKLEKELEKRGVRVNVKDSK